MIITNHAKKRIKQRGFSKIPLEIILGYGTHEQAPGGATKVFLGKKTHQKIVEELKQTIQLMDKAKGSTLIIHGNRILTAYKKYEKTQ
jgi:hypothetical protein